MMSKPQMSGWARVVVGAYPKRTLVRLLILVITAAVGFRYCLIPVSIQGASMEPAYFAGHWNLVNGLAYRFEKPKRGDVVAARRKGQKVDGKNFLFLKRVVGLPGEEVRVRGGNVYINGERLDEPYVKLKSTRSRYRFSLVLDEDQYFVIGDNRRVTGDGVFHIRQILGKVLF